MTDREKVIEGLERCLNESYGLSSNLCIGCPYGGAMCIDRLQADAIALLKEQDAVKPIFDEVDVCGRCGNCGHALTQQKMIGDDVLMDEMFDYCPSCGRKVKWNETD